MFFFMHNFGFQWWNFLNWSCVTDQCSCNLEKSYAILTKACVKCNSNRISSSFHELGVLCKFFSFRPSFHLNFNTFQYTFSFHAYAILFKSKEGWVEFFNEFTMFLDVKFNICCIDLKTFRKIIIWWVLIFASMYLISRASSMIKNYLPTYLNVSNLGKYIFGIFWPQLFVSNYHGQQAWSKLFIYLSKCVQLGYIFVFSAPLHTIIYSKDYINIFIFFIKIKSLWRTSKG